MGRIRAFVRIPFIPTPDDDDDDDDGQKKTESKRGSFLPTQQRRRQSRRRRHRKKAFLLQRVSAALAVHQKAAFRRVFFVQSILRVEQH